MKKYLLLFAVCATIKSAPVGDDMELYKYFPLKKPWHHIKQYKSRSLKKLCVKTIWANPRIYIGVDSKMPNEVKEYILDTCLSAKMQLHFGIKIEDMNFASRFISQLLLIRVCYQNLKKLDKDKKLQKIKLSEDEETILDEIPSSMQPYMCEYLEKKS